MLDTIRVNDNYVFSAKKICNDDFYNSVKDGDDNPPGGIFRLYEYLSIPDGAIIDNVLAYSFDERRSYQLQTSRLEKTVKLTKGKIYYIYAFKNIQSPHCTGSDYTNANLTTSPIMVRKNAE